MIGLVITTHSHLADEFLKAAGMIIGPPENATAVAVSRKDGVEEIRARLTQAVDEVGRDGEGVVIMADMFGGTPANMSISVLEGRPVEILTGVNLPMVLKFFNSREGLSLSELGGMLKAYGQQNIRLMSEVLQR